MKALAIVLQLAVFSLTTVAIAEDEIFSGPQTGERLAPFALQGVLGQHAGKEFDAIKTADGKPVLIVFVHKLTRPSIAVCRTVMEYAKQREKDGLNSAMVFLGKDLTALENRIKRAKHALPTDVYVSKDGEEGPGAYGLNRNVTLTVVLGVKNRVTNNFAIVQPGMAVDTPKIGAAIAKLLGDKKSPTLDQMRGVRDVDFRSLMAPVIQKTATEAEIDKAAKIVEATAKSNPRFRKRLIEATNRIAGSGKIDNYGTKKAQEYIKKWAKLPQRMAAERPVEKSKQDEPVKQETDS